MVQVASICKGRMRNRNQVTCSLVLIPEKGTLSALSPSHSLCLTVPCFLQCILGPGLPREKGESLAGGQKSKKFGTFPVSHGPP